MNPAAVLSILVKADGVAKANASVQSLEKNLATTSATGNRATGTLTKVGKAGHKASSGLFAAAKGAGALAAGYASVVGIEKSIKATETLGKTTLTLSKSYGLAADEAARWAAVSTARGADGKALSMNFKALSTQARNSANASKYAGNAFQDLGISQKDLRNHGDDLHWILSRVSDGLKDLPAGTNRAAIQAKLFGRTWQTLSPIVRDGSKSMDEQLKVADKYGATLSGKNLSAIKDTIKAQREHKLATLGLQVAIGTTLIPVVDKALEAFTRLIVQFRTGTGVAKTIVPIFDQVKQTFADLYAALKPVVEVVAPALMKFFQELPGPVQIALGALAGFAAIFLVTGPLGVGIALFAAGAILIKNNWSTVGPILQSVSQIAQDAFKAVVTAIGWVQTAFQNTVQWVRTAMDNVVTEIHKWDVLKAFLMPLIAAVGVFIKVAVAAWPTVFQAVFGVIKAVFTGAWTALKAVVTGGLQAIHGVILVIGGIFKGDFKQIWEGIKTIFSGALAALIGIVKGEVKAFTGAAKALGTGVVTGLVAGIEGAWDLIKGAASWLKDKIVGAVKDVFGIHSPSTVMAGLGLQLAEGLLHGFKGIDVVGFVKKTISGLGGVVGSAAGSVGGLLKSAGGKPSGNRTLGKRMMLAAGFAENQWGSLDALWNGESGWDNHARNKSSGAFGIPQALPASKMGAAAVAGDAAAQIAWGLSYIKGRYGTPANAYDQWRARSPHWYAGGTGGAARGMAWVGEQGPELVNFKGGETVFNNAQSMGLAGYAKGTGPSRAAIQRAAALRKYREALAAQKARLTKGGGAPAAAAAAADTGGGDPNQALIDSNKELQDAIDRKTDLETQLAANQLKIIALAGQGDQILAAVISAVNGGIGGRVGLGLQSPGYAGQVARY